MTTHTPELAALVKRLDTLERQNRWMRRAGAAALLLVGAAVLMGGQEPAKSKTGEADAVILRDAPGQERAWLGMDKAGPTLRFRDANGKDRLWLGVAHDILSGIMSGPGKSTRRNRPSSACRAPCCLRGPLIRFSLSLEVGVRDTARYYPNMPLVSYAR
jgi:hypothetical protein